MWKQASLVNPEKPEYRKQKQFQQRVCVFARDAVMLLQEMREISARLSEHQI